MKKAFFLSSLLISTSLVALPLYAVKRDRETNISTPNKVSKPTPTNDTTQQSKDEKPSKDNNWKGIFTPKDKTALKNAANKGDEVAQDVLLERWGNKLLQLDESKDLKWLTWEIMEKKVATHLGYLSIFFDAFTNKEGFQGKIEAVVTLVK